MSKKTIILCVALILALTLGLGGTLAYLTDTDADKNVMTVGRVQVVQNEQQRVEDGNGIFTSILEQFEDNKMLLPVTSRDNTPDTVTVGEWEVTMDDDLNNYIDKIISATNTGNTDAWVRTLVAVPTGAETDDPEEYWNKIESASDNWLHWNAMPDPEEGEQWSWPPKELGFITVDDVVYAVFAFTHHEKVAPGETTYPVVRGLYMDERVDMDVVKDEEGELVDQYYMMVNGEKQVIYDVPDKDGKVNMLVLTQAVQADGFATADEAFDKAFALGEDEKATLFNWFGGEDGWDEDDIGSPGDKNDTNNPPEVKDPVEVPVNAKKITNQEELKEAFSSGGEYVIADAFEVNEALVVSADTDLYSTYSENVISFTTKGKITLNSNVTLNVFGVEIDGMGSFDLDAESVVTSLVNSRSASVFHVNAGAALTLDGGTHITNVVNSGKALGPVSASGTKSGDEVTYATVTLKDVKIEGCAGVEGAVVGLNQYAKLFIEDGALITGNYSVNNKNHGLLRVYTGSVVTMNGGTIEKNYYSGNGMIGLYGDSQMIMNGGSIRKNAWFEDNQQANGWYPVIYVHSNSLFEMNGGSVYDNKVNYGVINSLNSSRVPAVDINGGMITNNLATNNGNKDAAFFVIQTGTDTLTIAPNATVTGTVCEYYDAGGNKVMRFADLSAYTE